MRTNDEASLYGSHLNGNEELKGFSELYPDVKPDNLKKQKEILEGMRLRLLKRARRLLMIKVVQKMLY